MWLYWGDHPLTVTPRVGWMADYRPQLVDLDPPPVKMSLSSLPLVPLSSQPRSPPPLPAGGQSQLPGKIYEQYFIHRQARNEARMKTETAQDKEVRTNRERAAALRQCPDRKGPAVYYWEPDSNSFRVRTLQTRAQAQSLWEIYSGPQKVFDSFTNEWDCCMLFGDDEPNTDDDDNIYPSTTTTSNAIPENATRSTPSLPPPHEDSSSSLPLPHQESSSSLPPPHQESTPSKLSLVTSQEDEDKSQGTPMDLDVQSPPYPPQNSPRVSPASSYRLALSRKDGSSMHSYDHHCRRDPRDDSLNRWYVHRPNTQNNSPGRYHERCHSRDLEYHRPYRDSRDDSPRQHHGNHSQDRRPYNHSRDRRSYNHSQDRRPYRDSQEDSPRRYHRDDYRDRHLRHDHPMRYHDLGVGGSRLMHCRSRSPS